jgi:hypothetical protein
MDEILPVEELTDEEINYLIQQHEQEASAISGLSDEQLERALKIYEAPGGNIDVTATPKYNIEEPDLSLGENIVGGVRELAAGATFEFADEAEAAVRSAASGEPYQKVLDDIRQKRALFEQANPATALGLNIAGGVGTMFVPGVNVLGRGVQAATGISKIASPVRRIAATGAIAGGLSGFGAGEDTEERLTNIVPGSLLGAGLGAGLYKAGDVARFGIDAVRAVRDKLPEADVTNAATDILIKSMQRAGKTPEEIAETLRLDREYGINTMFGQADPNLVAMTDVAALTPSDGTGRTQLAERIFRQQAGSKARVREQIKSKLPTPDYFASEDAIAKNLREIGETGYEPAFAVGSVKDPEIQTLLKNPGIAGALKRAKETADIEASNAAARGEDPSKYTLKMNMEPVLDEAGALVGLRPTGDVIPDVKTLHTIKRFLDEEIRGLYKAGDGTRAEALKATRNQLLGRLDKIVPEYREARKLYAGDLEIRDALQFGRQSGDLRPDEFARKYNKFSPGEQEAAKTGVVQGIMDGFSKATTNKNYAQNIIRSDDLMGKLQFMMKPEELRVFKAALKREAELFGQASRAAQGSPTFQRQVAKADVDEMIEQNTDSALELFMNPTPGNAFRAAMSAVRRLRNANVSKATWGQLSKSLSAASDDELANVFRAIDERMPAIQQGLKEREARTTRAAVAGAMAQAPTPEIDRERLPEDVEFAIPAIEEPSGLSAMPSETPPVAAPEIDPDVAMRQFWEDFAKLSPQEQEEFKRYITEKGGISGTITETGEPQ